MYILPRFEKSSASFIANHLSYRLFDLTQFIFKRIKRVNWMYIHLCFEYFNASCIADHSGTRLPYHFLN